MLEMNARSLQQKLETERELKQRLLEEVTLQIQVITSEGSMLWGGLDKTVSIAVLHIHPSHM